MVLKEIIITEKRLMKNREVASRINTLVDCPTMDDKLSDEVLKSSDRLKQELQLSLCG